MKTQKKFYYTLFLYLTLLVFVCTITMASVVNYFSSKFLTEEVYEANQNALNSIVKNTDTMLEGIENVSFQLAVNATVNYYLSVPFSEDYVRLKRLSETVDSIKVSNNYLDSIYIYYSGTGELLTSPEGKLDINNYYDKDWLKNLKFQGLTQWYFDRNLTKTEEETVKESNVISHIRYFPIASVNKEGAVVLNINKEKLRRNLINTDNPSEGIIIFDSELKPVLTTVSGKLDYSMLSDRSLIERIIEKGHEKVKLDKKDYLISCVKGANGWRYCMLTPFNPLFNLQRVLRNVIISCALLSIIIGVALTFLLSKKLYLPIRGLMGVFNNQEGNPSNALAYSRFEEFNSIQESAVKIVEDNRMLLNKFNQAMSYAYERILLGLLHGSISFEKLNGHNIKLPFKDYNKFTVLVIDFDDYEDIIQSCTDEELDTVQKKIMELCNNSFNGFENSELQVITTYPYQVACLLALYDMEVTDEEVLHNIFKSAGQVKEAIMDSLGVSVTIGISRIAHRSIKINRLYEQAVNAVTFRIVQGRNSIIYYGNVDIAKGYSYPQKTEESLITALKAADREQVSAEIKEFIGIVSSSRTLDEKQVRYYFAQLFGEITKLIYSIGGSMTEICEQENIFEKLAKFRFVPEIETYLTMLCERIINYIQNKQDNRYETIVNKAVEFIHENYGNDQINVDLIAENVFLSSNYLERLFKAQKNQTIMDYLSNLRMEKAKEMLGEANLKVETIAGKVGYTSSRGFIRAFKKIEGVTPGEFRKRLIGVTGE